MSKPDPIRNLSDVDLSNFKNLITRFNGDDKDVNVNVNVNLQKENILNKNENDYIKDFQQLNFNINNIRLCNNDTDNNNYKKSIIKYMQNNNYDDLIKIINENINNIKPYLNNILIIASVYYNNCKEKNIKKFVEFLIKNGANINYIDNNNCENRPIILASLFNNIKMIKTLIKYKNISINVLNKFGDSALSYSTVNGNVKILIKLLNKSARSSDKNSIGYTPLMLASMYGHLKCVEYICLLRKIHLKENINTTNDSKEQPLSALSLAIMNYNYKITKYLISQGANINIKNIPLLAYAIKYYNNNMKIIEKLIKKKVDVNAVDPTNGNTALIYALDLDNSFEIVQKLIEYDVNININIKNKDGKSALDISKERGFNGITELLKPTGKYDSEFEHESEHESEYDYKNKRQKNNENENENENAITIYDENGNILLATNESITIKFIKK
jgi:ankyrin repeat protein